MTTKSAAHKFILTVMQISVEEGNLRWYLMIKIGLDWNEVYRIANDTLDEACGVEFLDG